MAGGNPGPGPRMIVVGDRHSGFVRKMARLAREHEIEMARCDDVWMAVAETARARGRRVLVTGTLEELARESGRFFGIAAVRRVRCCCVLGESAEPGRRGLLQALRSGVAVVSDADMPDVLDAWLNANGDHSPRSGLGSLSDDELRPTREEIMALLGHETDA